MGERKKRGKRSKTREEKGKLTSFPALMRGKKSAQQNICPSTTGPFFQGVPLSFLSHPERSWPQVLPNQSFSPP